MSIVRPMNETILTLDDERLKPSATTSTPIPEDFHGFVARLRRQPPLGWYVPGLIPDEGICLWHGQPRDFKSLCALELALALTTGRRAFDLDRFTVARRVRVAYFTEEDSPRMFAARLGWLTAMQGEPEPGWFFPVVRQGASFDREETRRFVMQRIHASRAEVVIFDPLRSLTGGVDKGPADFQPVAQFLRQVQNETSAKTVLLVHHDVKPTASATDRSRSQQASGGGLFSIADCPVAFQKLAWNRTAVFPEDYKLSGNPTPFEVTFDSDARESEDGPQFGSWVRPVAVSRIERDIAAGADAEKLLAFLRQTTGRWCTASEAAAGAKVRDLRAGQLLKELHRSGQVQMCTGQEAVALGRSPKAKLWRLLP